MEGVRQPQSMQSVHMREQGSPKPRTLRSREPEGLRETGDAEVVDLAIQDRALKKERRVAVHAKERPVTQAAQCHAKCIYQYSVLPSAAHHITCHSPESVIRR